MTKKILVALLLAGCGTATGGGGGGAGYGTGDPYFPVIENGRWTYNVIVGSKVLGQLTEDQALVTTVGNLTTAHVRFTGHQPFGDAAATTQTDLDFRVTPAGISSQDAQGKETLLLARPLVQGTSWTTNDASLHVAGTDDVSVPAGAYRGALLITGSNATTDARAWLAFGTGLVKLELVPRQGEAIRLELAAFTP